MPIVYPFLPILKVFNFRENGKNELKVRTIS